MDNIVYFHRNLKCGFSINKVTQTIICDIASKKEFFVPCFRADPLSILINIFFVFIHRKRHSINHITGGIHYCILGLIGCRSVLTIHDVDGLDFYKYPYLKRLLYEWLWLRLPLKFATRVICISEETKKAVLGYTKRNDIVVIHDAVDSKFEYFPKKINLINPRMLIIGTAPNKNLLRTFDALRGISCFLVIVGKINETQKKSLEMNCLHYENKFNLTDDEIVEEYKKCDIVLFVSLYEGFGMPVIEANAVGRPIICSNIPVLREVAAAAAEYVNPLDSVAIYHGILNLINNPSYCEALIERGKKNVLRFSQKKITCQLLYLYEKLLDV